MRTFKPDLVALFVVVTLVSGGFLSRDSFASDTEDAIDDDSELYGREFFSYPEGSDSPFTCCVKTGLVCSCYLALVSMTMMCMPLSRDFGEMPSHFGHTSYHPHDVGIPELNQPDQCRPHPLFWLYNFTDF